MNVVLAILLLFGSSSHDIQVAYFKVQEVNDSLVVEFVFEKGDLLSVLNNNDSELSDEELETYLKSNFSISINDDLQNLIFGEISKRGNHVSIQGKSELKNKEIRIIAIKNECLLKISGHSNIVEVNLYNKQRDFLMNIERTSIEINY